MPATPDLLQCQSGTCTRNNTDRCWCIATQPIKGQRQHHRDRCCLSCKCSCEVSWSWSKMDGPNEWVASPSTKNNYTVKDSLSKCEGLITQGCQIVIPQSMRQEMVERIHDRHQSLSIRGEWAKETVWWPKLSADIKCIVETCHFWQENKRTRHKEPLHPTPLPEWDWHVNICKIWYSSPDSQRWRSTIHKWDQERLLQTMWHCASSNTMTQY